MITLTHLDGHRIVLNADLIERLESVPDTMITLTTGRHLYVHESVETVTHKVEAYQQRSRAQGSAASGEVVSGKA